MNFISDWNQVREKAFKVGYSPAGDDTCALWVRFMQRQGYKKRMHGDLLNKSIVDAVVSGLTSFETGKNL